MQDKVVVGSQDDALRGLTRFSDNEGDIIWPAWRAELKQRVAFEFGKIGNQIIEGEVKESDVDLGEVTEPNRGLQPHREHFAVLNMTPSEAGHLRQSIAFLLAAHDH